MTTAIKKNVETRTIRGEVTQLPHLTKRKAAKSGKFFNTAALRYWSEDDQDFGVLSTSFDTAERVVATAKVDGKFIAKVKVDGPFMNVDDIRFIG